MTFVAGAVLGVAVGLAVGFVLRRPRRAPIPDASVTAGPRARRRRTAVAVLVALAVVAGGLAFARHGGADHRDATPSPTITSTSDPVAPESTAASTGAVVNTVSVPKVIGAATNPAVAMLERAGLRVSVTGLALPSVPDGYVISQRPLPDAQVTVGSTVALIVSGAA